MNIRSLLAVTCLLCCSATTMAQKRENVYLLKNSGTKVDKLEDADMIRVITEAEPGSKMYDVVEYYKDNTPKLKGKSSAIDPLTYEGMVITYYPSGKRQEIINYQQGKRNGEYYKYFPNGKSYLHAIYEITDKPGLDKMILDCADSTGNVTVKDGIGHYIGYNADFTRVEEEGDIKAGQRTGQWQGVAKDFNNDLKFTEEYKEGVLKSGKATEANGDSYSYTQRSTPAEYKGGVSAFGRFLSDVIRYPPSARLNRIQGRVVMSFVVKPDGTTGDYVVKESPNQELSDEAIRVLKISPKWVPGKYYGKAVRVNYSVPISFTLNN